MRRTVIDIGVTFGRQFAAGLMQLGLVLVVARTLGPDGAGTYAVAMLLPKVMGQLFNLGLASSNVYFVASKRVSVQDAWAATRDLVVVMSVLGLAGGAGLVVWLGDDLFPGAPTRLLLLALAIYPLTMTMNVTVALFQALQDFKSYNIAVLLQPFLAIIGALTLVAAERVSLTTVLQMVALTHAIGLSVALAILRGRIGNLAMGTDRMKYLKPALVYGLKAHLSNILTFLTYRIDIFLVNLIAGPAAAGLYNIAVRLVEQIWLISKAVSTVIFPRLSSIAHDEEALKSFTAFMARTVLWVTLFASAVLAAIAEPLIEILFGPDFKGATIPLLILLPGVALLSCARVLANDMAARGRVGVNTVLSGVVLLTNITFNMILIPEYGIAGAAAATTISYTLVLVTRLIVHQILTESKWWMALVPMPEDVATLRQTFFSRKSN